MCARQFEDVIPLLEAEFRVFGVSFDGFDGSGETTYISAKEEAEKLAQFIKGNLGGRLDMLFAESFGCGPAVMLMSDPGVEIGHMILSGAEYPDYGILNGLLLKVMPKKQYATARDKSMPAWALKFMGQTEERDA